VVSCGWSACICVRQHGSTSPARPVAFHRSAGSTGTVEFDGGTGSARTLGRRSQHRGPSSTRPVAFHRSAGSTGTVEFDGSASTPSALGLRVADRRY
jgi:hypothetical protein